MTVAAPKTFSKKSHLAGCRKNQLASKIGCKMNNDFICPVSRLESSLLAKFDMNRKHWHLHDEYGQKGIAKLKLPGKGKHWVSLQSKRE